MCLNVGIWLRGVSADPTDAIKTVETTMIIPAIGIGTTTIIITTMETMEDAAVTEIGMPTALKIATMTTSLKQVPGGPQGPVGPEAVMKNPVPQVIPKMVTTTSLNPHMTPIQMMIASMLSAAALIRSMQARERLAEDFFVPASQIRTHQ